MSQGFIPQNQLFLTVVILAKLLLRLGCRPTFQSLPKQDNIRSVSGMTSNPNWKMRLITGSGRADLPPTACPSSISHFDGKITRAWALAQWTQVPSLKREPKSCPEIHTFVFWGQASSPKGNIRFSQEAISSQHRALGSPPGNGTEALLSLSSHTVGTEMPNVLCDSV